MMRDPRSRFSSRVEDYDRYRPGYPEGLVDLLEDAGAVREGTVVADIGSGTGLLSRLFLEAGLEVHAVEPNREMRVAAEDALSSAGGFYSIVGTAEETTLPDASVDLVSAGQAFHWFDQDAAREEWLRITRPGGWWMLVWNERITRGDPFLEAYERLLQRHGTDYRKVDHRQVQDPGLIGRYFGASVQHHRLPNRQDLGLEGLVGRAASSSYLPERGTPAFEALRRDLTDLYEKEQQGDRVRIRYVTDVYLGQPCRDTG